jgi:ABC-type transporter Mla MlaB component
VLARGELVVYAMAVDRPDLETFALEGPATIYEVSALRESLRAALSQGRDLRIDLGETGKWDLAGLQLLISCVKTGLAQGRKIRVARTPDLCVEIAERCGLADWLRSVME